MPTIPPNKAKRSCHRAPFRRTGTATETNVEKQPFIVLTVDSTHRGHKCVSLRKGVTVEGQSTVPSSGLTAQPLMLTLDTLSA